MALTKRHRSKSKLLSSTRPPVHRNSAPKSQLSSRATRSLIRNHHNLQKQLSRALADNDTTLAASLEARIEQSGGLSEYQKASIQGQSSERGGDSSKILIRWIEEEKKKWWNDVDANRPIRVSKPRLLEVGSLKTDNACARSGIFEIERIDLNSQHKDILQQDFMERPIPNTKDLLSDGFDLISLSLVINYIGDASARGELLKRVASFLRAPSSKEGWESVFLPGLFLVMPAPCVLNSRYLDEDRLNHMMASLGYVMERKKVSDKLVYYYWRYTDNDSSGKLDFGKVELRKGKDRNNFTIILR